MSTLEFQPAFDHLDLLFSPVREALESWPGASQVGITAIAPGLADTAALVEATGLLPEDSANCVIVGGKRDGDERVAACLVLASTRADVNRVVRKRMNVRRASFLPMDTAVEATGMQYGGITPVGLPSGWSLYVDTAVLERDQVVIGAGTRGAKLALPGALCAKLPGAEVVEGLAH